MEDVPKRSFSEQAARAGWIFPLVSVGLMVVGNSVIRSAQSPITGLIMAAVFTFLLLGGIIFGIIGCFGVKRYGAKTTLIPGLIGTFLSMAFLGLLITVATTSFFKYREALIQENAGPLKILVEQFNQQLPTMVDSETRLDKISVLGPNLLEYYYTFVDSEKNDYDVIDFIETLQPQLMEIYQNNDGSKVFRENRIFLQHSYHDKNGQLIASIVVPSTEAPGN